MVDLNEETRSVASTGTINGRTFFDGRLSFRHHPIKQTQQSSKAPITLERERLIKPTIKRYIILFLFCLNSANKAFQWIQIPASTQKITYYYDVSNYVINTTSVLFMLAFVFLSIPSCYIIEIIGLRAAVLVGSGATAIGAVIKCFSCSYDGIYLLFLGQILVSLGEQFIFSIPSRIASVWFPDNQVSSAVGLCVLGNTLGIALGFLLPQWLLDSAETKDDIGQQLYNMFLITALISVASFLADWALFDEAPKYAPGAARLLQIEEEEANKNHDGSFIDHMKTLSKQIKDLFADNNFKLLTISYGINVGIGYSIHTIINQMLEPLWPGDDLLVGNCGFINIISGAFGSAILGSLLDRSHKYRLINILLTVGGIASIVIFGAVVSGLHSHLAIYIGCVFVGFFQTALVVGGLELAVEITYPAPELVTSSMINISPQIFGTIFVYASSYINDNHGALATNIFFIICFTIALIILCMTKETLKRQNAIKEEELRNNRKMPA